MTYEITYFHIISLIYNVYFVKLSISLQDLGTIKNAINLEFPLRTSIPLYINYQENHSTKVPSLIESLKSIQQQKQHA